MSYCARDPGAIPCLERNATGANRSGDIEAETDAHLLIARNATLFHDAFDGSNWRGNATPTNGDAWATVANRLQYTPTDTSDQLDEAITLPGSALRSWIANWQRFSESLTTNAFFAGLSGTLYDEGASWCDACDLFALHSEDVAPWTPGGWAPIEDRWRFCNERPADSWVGPPPEDSLNMDAATCQPCPGHRISQPLGTCTQCAPGEIAVGNACQACPNGSVPGWELALPAITAVNRCDACLPNHISQGNQCVPCAPGQFADLTQNQCVDCPVDITVNMAEEEYQCGWLVSRRSNDLGAADPATCDATFTAEYQRLDRIAACGRANVEFSMVMDPPAYDQASCEASWIRGVVQEHAAAGWTEVQNVLVEGQWHCTADQSCQCQLSTTYALPSSSIGAGVDAVRLIVRASNAVVLTAAAGRTPTE